MLIGLFLGSGLNQLQARDGYEISVSIDDFNQDKLILGYYMGSRQYVVDTAYRNADDAFVFEGDSSLDGGVYLVILPPKNEYFHLLINPDEQHFSVQTKQSALLNSLEVSGSSENDLYYEYLRFINTRMAERGKLEATMKSADEKKKAKASEKLVELHKEVLDHQKGLIEKRPKSMTALLLLGSQEITIPDPPAKADEQEQQLFRFKYYRQHFFKNLDLNDERIVRTPYLYGKVMTYLDQLTSQDGDSLNTAIDYLFKLFGDNEAAQKFYLPELVNKYAKSDVVGMDKVYVHLIDQYYVEGKVPWASEKDLKQLQKAASKMRPTLIGKKAPNINVFDPYKQSINLHKIEAKYILLYFWSPDCGHCKKKIPVLRDMYMEKLLPLGVKVVAVCSKTYKDEKACWDFVKDKKMNNFLNVWDPYYRSKFKILYNIEQTPKLFLLDKNKNIISKQIDVTQVIEVIEMHELKQKGLPNRK